MTDFVDIEVKRHVKSKRFPAWHKVSKELRASEFATFLGVERKKLDTFVQQGLRQKEDGTFDVMDYIAFVIEQANKDSGVNQLDAEKIRKTAADATLAEMRIAEAEGRLVERQAIIRPVRAYLVTACKLIQDLPKRLSRRFPVNQRAEVSTMADEEVKDTLATLNKAHEIIDNVETNE